jgi:hypothetical protein
VSTSAFCQECKKHDRNALKGLDEPLLRRFETFISALKAWVAVARSRWLHGEIAEHTRCQKAAFGKPRRCFGSGGASLRCPQRYGSRGGNRNGPCRRADTRRRVCARNAGERFALVWPWLSGLLAVSPPPPGAAQLLCLCAVEFLHRGHCLCNLAGKKSDVVLYCLTANARRQGELYEL